MHTARATTTAFRGRPSTRATAAIAALLALLASSLGTTGPSAAATLDDLATRVVVEARADLGAVASAVAEHGGEVVEVLAPFGMVVADVPAGAVDDLEDEAATGTVTEDTPLQVQSAEGVEHAVRATVAAPTAADAGAGVGVVVVDTGVADHPDLGDRVVARYTFARGRDRRALDPHGHGTFLAGLVAGSGAASGGQYAGVAPGAHLVSVRVADADGTTSLSRVLTGLAAADLARDRHDAPVVLLALSGPTGDVPDPVMIVLEMLWSRGSTVVVPAGNGDQVGSPGADPYLLTAGALDDQGTPDRADDVVAPWSAHGPNPWGHAKPDLVAPGTSVVGLRAPGSTIDTEHPSARVADDYFIGSGTSMAAASTAGAAAVLLAAQPDLDPNGVKGRLMGSTSPAPEGADRNHAGTGVLDVTAALASDAGPANGDLAPLPTPLPDRGNGRGNGNGNGNGNGRGVGPGPAGWSWDGWSWDGWSWDGWSWDGWSWDGDAWSGWSWDGWSWDGWSWDGWSWDGWSWDGWSWDGWSWDGWSWSNDTWGPAPA